LELRYQYSMYRWFLSLLVAICVASIAAPVRAEPPRPDHDLAVILVRDAIAALNQANWTGNYTVLRDYASPNFAAVNDPARLSAIFAGLRKQGLNLAPSLVLTPQFTRAELIENSAKLRLSGFVPSRPKQINFDMIFEPLQDRWRLFGISVTASDEGGGSRESAEQPASPAPQAKPAFAIPVPVSRP
jgi:hypothetical protein